VDIHDRMPVFLSEDHFAPWLNGEAGAEVLKPAPDDFLQRWPVSSASIARRPMRMTRR
jgi:putative SOS response-associated peptidase YedK